MLNSVSRTRGFSIKVALGEAPTPGPRPFVTGKRGPKFTVSAAAKSTTGWDCLDCHGFQRVKVRRDGQLVTVECPCVTLEARASDLRLASPSMWGTGQPSPAPSGPYPLPLPKREPGKEIDAAPSPARMGDDPILMPARSPKPGEGVLALAG